MQGAGGARGMGVGVGTVYNSSYMRKWSIWKPNHDYRELTHLVLPLQTTGIKFRKDLKLINCHNNLNLLSIMSAITARVLNKSFNWP